MSRPVVMDLDTGIDDALALLLTVRSPELDLVGVGTVTGNVHAQTAATNSLRVLEVAGATDVPVAVGAERWLLEPDPGHTWVHGTDGMGETDQPAPDGAPSPEGAVEQLLRLSHEHAGELVVIAVAPLTNLALALRSDPGLADRLARIVIMGGSARDGGNRAPWGEANVACDPEAARIVFAADVPRTMVGLDVTMQVTFDAADLDRLAASSDAGAALAAQLLPFYLDVYTRILGERRCAVHDALAVAAAVDPTLLNTEALPVDVETHGELTRGMTVVDLRARFPGWPGGQGPHSDVALDVDADRAHDLILGRLLGDG